MAQNLLHLETCYTLCCLITNIMHIFTVRKLVYATINRRYIKSKDNTKSNIKSIQGHKSKCGVNGIVVVKYINVSNIFLCTKKGISVSKRLPAALV